MRWVTLLVLSGCLTVTVDGDPTPPTWGKKYDCSHVEYCHGVATEAGSGTRCAETLYDAETAEFEECEAECSCFFSCTPHNPSLCLVSP